MPEDIKLDLAKLFIDLLLGCKGYPKCRAWAAALQGNQREEGGRDLRVSLFFLGRTLFILTLKPPALGGHVLLGSWEQGSSEYKNFHLRCVGRQYRACVCNTSVMGVHLPYMGSQT